MKQINKTNNRYFVIFYTKNGETIPLLNKKGVFMQLFQSGTDAEKAAQKLYVSKPYSGKLDGFEVFLTGQGVLQVT